MQLFTVLLLVHANLSIADCFCGSGNLYIMPCKIRETSKYSEFNLHTVYTVHHRKVSLTVYGGSGTYNILGVGPSLYIVHSLICNCMHAWKACLMVAFIVGLSVQVILMSIVASGFFEGLLGGGQYYPLIQLKI